MKTGTILGIVTLACTILLTIFSGCSFDNYVEVNEGEYTPDHTGAVYHDDSGTRLIESMTIDRQNKILEIHLTDNAVITSAFVSRPEKEWPSGCPANLGSTKMEVLILELDKLVIGDISLDNPVLVRTCPENPERVVLREDVQTGGSSTACAGNDRCIHFKPGN